MATLVRRIGERTRQRKVVLFLLIFTRYKDFTSWAAFPSRTRVRGAVSSGPVVANSLVLDVEAEWAGSLKEKGYFVMKTCVR